MVKERKKTMSEDQKGSIRKISYQIEFIKKKIEIIKKNKIQILELNILK